jgi:hypothetical protein
LALLFLSIISATIIPIELAVRRISNEPKMKGDE